MSLSVFIISLTKWNFILGFVSGFRKADFASKAGWRDRPHQESLFLKHRMCDFFSVAVFLAIWQYWDYFKDKTQIWYIPETFEILKGSTNHTVSLDHFFAENCTQIISYILLFFSYLCKHSYILICYHFMYWIWDIKFNLQEISEVCNHCKLNCDSFSSVCYQLMNNFGN